MRSVVVVGAGNIGSHLIPLVARMPEVGRLLVIDRDRYEERNLAGQSILVRDVGRPKAVAQRTAIRGLAPSVEAEALVADLEDVAVGRLRGDLILACLDSRRARQIVNQAAFHLGVPWIDSGVQADGSLARVNVYLPGPDRPCLECAWGESDYRAIEQRYPCEAGASPFATGPEAPATNAPAALGALAASLQALEAHKILTGRCELAAAGKQIQIDAARQIHLVTSFRFQPGCRLGDHAAWTLIEIPLPPSRISFRALAARMPGRPGAEACTFAVERRPFALASRCSGCGRARGALRVDAPSPAWSGRCASCGGRVVIAGFDRRERLGGGELTAAQLDRPLGSLGVRRGDVLRVENREMIARYVIVGDSR